MLGIKTLRRESESSGKSEFTQNQYFGLEVPNVGFSGKALCFPMQGQLSEGIGGTGTGGTYKGKPATLITNMAQMVVEKAKQCGYLCYVALDAYFSVGPVFEILKQAVNEEGKRLVHVITRAKGNYVAYPYPEARQGTTGEKDKIILRDFFDSPELFTKTELKIDGQTRTVHYYCRDLLWKPINDPVRFVCIIDGTDRYILMSSDLELTAQQIISIYSCKARENVKTNQGDNEMDQQMRVAKQMMDLQKASFGSMVANMIMFWDQTDKMLGNLLDQTPWVPEEGKKIVREWIAGNKRGCETFKNAVDDGFSKLESSISREK